MKIVWFGHNCFRIHYGGQILVLEPQAAPAGIDAAELVSGADRTFSHNDPALHAFDAAQWSPRRPLRPLDMADAVAAPSVARLEQGVVIESGEEPMLIVLWGAAGQEFGRWADGAVMIVADGDAALTEARAALNGARARLLALALAPESIDRAVEVLRPHLGDAGLMVLEEGLALEI